jgi:hypothetical protein
MALTMIHRLLQGQWHAPSTTCTPTNLHHGCFCPTRGPPTHRNAAGYDAAVRWRARFTHISPVWYQLRLDQEGALVLVGGHDVDAGWMGRLKAPPGLVRCRRRSSSSSRLTGGLPAWLAASS